MHDTRVIILTNQDFHLFFYNILTKYLIFNIHKYQHKETGNTYSLII